MESLLYDVFSAFSGGSTEMDGRAFVKCLRDSRLLDSHKLKPRDADIIFAKYKFKGARKINFDEFCNCLADVAVRRDVEMEIVVRLVCDARAPDYESGSACPSLAASGHLTGPERFYYDKSTYTGTHKQGGPTVDGDLIQVSDLVNRGTPLEDGLYRKKVDDGLPVLLGKNEGRGSRRAKSPKGPERFHYDKMSYTGTQRHGGPSNMGSGLPKESGYDDLRQLVARDHVQDDQLHRRMSPQIGADVQQPQHQPMGQVQSMPAKIVPPQQPQQPQREQPMGPVHSAPVPTQGQVAPRTVVIASGGKPLAWPTAAVAAPTTQQQKFVQALTPSFGVSPSSQPVAFAPPARVAAPAAAMVMPNFTAMPVRTA